MLTQLNNVAPNVVAFRATGDVNKTDYDTVLIPAVDAMARKTGRINFMLIIDTALKNFTIRALLKDIGVGLKHFTKWHKMAIVSESGPINTFTDLFSYIAPGEAKGFTHAEMEQARLWVSTE